MITLKEWAGMFSAARVEIRETLPLLVAENAELAAGIAHAEIGHLQPQKDVGLPVPSHFPEWDELAERTKDDKRNLGFSGPEYSPLYRSGQGDQSIEAVAIGLTGGVVSNDIVMFYHEFGTARMPPRPVFAPAVAVTMPIFEKALATLAVNVLTPKK